MNSTFLSCANWLKCMLIKSYSKSQIILLFSKITMDFTLAMPNVPRVTTVQQKVFRIDLDCWFEHVKSREQNLIQKNRTMSYILQGCRCFNWVLSFHSFKADTMSSWHLWWWSWRWSCFTVSAGRWRKGYLILLNLTINKIKTFLRYKEN